MRPVLFAIPFGNRSLELATYGFAIALGFSIGVMIAVRQARKAGTDPGAILDAAFWILVAGMVGARAFFILQHAGHYARLCTGGEGARSLAGALGDCLAPLRIWEGGLVFHGGALTAAAAVALFARKRKLSFGKLADHFAPGLALGHAIGRLGCFFAGCCYGHAGLPGPPGVRFPAGSVAHMDYSRAQMLAPGAASTAPLHPAQLYEALLELIVFFALMVYGKRRRFWGATALMYAIVYGTGRIVVELFRGDPARSFLAQLTAPNLAKLLLLPMDAPLFLSTAQAMAVVIACAAAVLLWRGARVSRSR